jgi:hypothetical protein
MMDEANRAMGPVPAAVSASKRKQAGLPDQGDALATALEGHAFGVQN